MKINLIAPINKLSYGYVSSNILKELLKAGHEVSLFPIGKIDSDERYFESVNKALNFSKTFDINSPSIIIWHHFGLKQFKRFKGPHIGFPIFENDRFSKEDIENFNSMDMVLLTCDWYKNIIDDVKEIKVKTGKVNLGVDPEIFRISHKKTIERKLDNITRFITVGKWEVRKSHWEIAQAFHKMCFTPKIEITFVCHNPFLSSKENLKWEKMVKDAGSYALTDKIRVINKRFDSQDDIIAEMQNADFGVFPARAEGWNLELNEMMAMNKMCVVTNYSAHTEYCNYDNSMIVDIKNSEPAFDGEFFFGQMNWAKISEKEISRIKNCMIELDKAKKNDTLDARVAESVKHLTWENSASQLINNVNKIL